MATVLNSKRGEFENKIHDVSGLASTAVLDTKIGEVENKVPVIHFIKKTDYNVKIPDWLLLIKINLGATQLMQK